MAEKLHLLPLTKEASQSLIQSHSHQIITHNQNKLNDISLTDQPPLHIIDRRRIIKDILKHILITKTPLNQKTFLLCPIQPTQHFTQSNQPSPNQCQSDSNEESNPLNNPNQPIKTEYVIFGIVDCLPKSNLPLTVNTNLYFEGSPLGIGSHSIHLVFDVPPPTPVTEESLQDSPPIETQQSWTHWIKSVLTVTPPRASQSLSETAQPSERQPCADPQLPEALKERLNRFVWVLYKGQYFHFANKRYLITNLFDSQGNEIFHPLISFGIQQVHISFATDEVFNRVLLAPLADTIPSVYRVDLFNDCLRPYLLRHSLRRFAQGDLLEIDGIQFKILKTDPPSRYYRSVFSEAAVPPLDLAATANNLLTDPLDFNGEEESRVSSQRSCVQRRRLGVETKIFLGRPVLPHWLDILPLQQQNAVLNLPPQLQTFALLRQLGETSPNDIERVLRTMDVVPAGERLGLDGIRENQVREACQRYVIDESEASNMESFFCSVCLSGESSGVGEGDSAPRIVELPCHHQFHYRCVIHWFRRSSFCPLCKRNLEAD
eukprot:Protomagalhaensia_wolfi_Nauph_80__531@NODE_12_length_5322_cov_729_645845_g9_i0_p1_GENE_NODE_12_length_5322_cov_729_645845_g9_i0NODE_12_length_5322_cov_729_645845_g9_i0_p1_ORF_typecomplete_len546_score89_72zfRING_2/PF13639_6/8_7e03zfRING_2/PF13639_6/5_7e10zfrbx1/PF12678_7/1_7e07zfC3HC4_3/PF13920_6/3_9e06zfRING_11/PF17123_5/3_9e05zfC3HC4/PF00097_25/0_00046zfC3HC4_2/PF13923_6/0_0011zfANAPC11/PF12861_7/0_00097FANCL_C/PF11793_8/0_018zfRING_5/PF14634_6/0_015Zn_ribbon_17/PF17120_5/9e03Zn_ribbon_17/PF17